MLARFFAAGSAVSGVSGSVVVTFVPILISVALATGCASAPSRPPGDAAVTAETAPPGKPGSRAAEDSAKPARPAEPPDESIPVETLELPPEKLDPLPPDEEKDPPLEAEDVSVLFPPDAVLLDHGALQIAFSERHGIAVYVRYQLTAEQLRARFIRRDANPFAPDPQLVARAAVTKRKTASQTPPSVATKATYSRSGYDRGHLAPAEDMSWNADAFIASFYMSNMAPQKGTLNQQSWRVLEEHIRGWACGEEKITVITGPLLGPRPKRLKNLVPVPDAFYKVIIDETPPRKIAAFIYEQNTPARTPPIQRQVRIAEITKRTGVPLFASPRTQRAGLSPLTTWKTATCPEHRPQVSAKSLLRELKLRPRLSQPREEN